jgi:hypothetical protein
MLDGMISLTAGRDAAKGHRARHASNFLSAVEL